MSVEDQQSRLRRKLVNNELNPFADFLLSIVLLCFIPFIYVSSLLHDKLMFKFLNNTYIYNVSWEDPRMDHRVFHLTEKDHVLTIASAGDNVLDYIIEGAKVTAVDFNSCQIALTELKKAAIIELEHEQFFEIFSYSNMKLLKSVYFSKLRKHLSSTSAKFWDDGINTIKSFMYSGTSGNMAYFALRVMFPLFGLGFIRDEIEKKTDIIEFRKKLSGSATAIRAIAWLMDNIMLRGGCCFAGVPERQMNLGIHRPNNMAIVTEKIMFETDLVNDNYFFAGYFLGYYTPNNCPRYLRKENFAAMKKYLSAGKLTLIHGTLLQAIQQTTVPFTVASLLDHMDWMTDSMITEEISALVNGKMDMENGKIYWRTFADAVHAAPLKWMNPVKVDDHDDRVCMYWTTWIAHLKDVPVDFHNRINTFKPRGLISNLITGAKIVTFPLWKPLVAGTLNATGQAKNMEAFYKYQKNDYDAFRESLLWARPSLMEAMPLLKKGGMVWVDVGGGTARNLEYFTPDTIRKYFKSIYILDVSSSLLEIASERVKQMGLEDIVTVVEHDFTADSVFKVLPNENTVDIITMSYSYSMIPNKAGAMLNAAKLIKSPNSKIPNSGGLIMIADFFCNWQYDDTLPFSARMFRNWESKFHTWWFAQDHVHLLTNQELEYASHMLECVWDDRFRGSVPFIPFLKPYHGVYVLRKK